MTLINKAKVRRHTLEMAANGRKMDDGTPRFTRISKEYFERVEAAVRQHIASTVHSLPSAGRTI